MDAVGAKTATEFARALGLDLNSPRTVRRWLDGHNEPDYQNTMKILRAAGMLKSADGPRRETADDWGRIEELLEEVIVLLREREGDVPATRRAQEPR
jgi:DNA-binding transcriptional ArsR family regulator